MKMQKKFILAGLIAGFALASIADVAAQSTTLIPLNGTWKYLDNNLDPGPTWTSLGFNDATWLSGAAQLGYGDGDEATIVDDGPDTSRFITTWFRKVITVPNPSAFSSASLNLTYDDGAVVYINGIELFRVNMPEGVITASTLAPTTAADPLATASSPVPVSALVAGDNIVAVEIHQQAGTSSDISMALELTAQIDTTAPTIASQGPPASSIVQSLNSIEILFSEPVQGVEASDLLINGQPATNIIFGVPGQFVFSFPPPPTGAVSVAFIASHGITDLAAVPNAFAGASWNYTVDPNILPATFLISEFMASNTKTLNDNYGNQSDWIEIYNPQQSGGNLLGWFLTDDTNNLTKWRFPSRIIDPNGYIVVFASGRDETNNAAFLHTSFQLNNSGEFLALVDPNTNIVSAFSPVYPAQSADVSYGRDRLNPTITGYFNTATPRAANSTSGTGFGPEVIYSRNSGTFPTNRPFNLVLSTAVPGASIYYSFGTNVPGSNVSATVFRYINPISVTNTLAIRARAFAGGALPGPISSRTYIGLSTQTNVLGFNSELPIMIIHNYGQGTYPADSTLSGERFTYIQTFENDCGSASMTNAPTLAVRGTMHTRGSSTQTSSAGKAAFFLEVRDEFDDDLEVPLLGLPPESDWVLYAPNNFEPALFHNPLAFQLAQDGGEYASRYRFFEVFIKDDLGTPGPIVQATGFTGTASDYHGIYVLEEKIKRDNNRVNIEKLEPEHKTYPEVTGGYLLSIDRTDAGKAIIPVTGGSLNQLEPNTVEFANTNRHAQSNYIKGYFNSFAAGLAGANLTNATLAGGAINTNHYSSYIDVNSWVRRHVHEVLTFNVDALRLSGYFYKDRNKKLEYGPAWDYDRTQGSTDGRDANPRTYRSQSGDLGTDFFNFQPWWGTLFRAPDFWQAWIDRYQTERRPGASLSTDNIMMRIDELYNQLKDAQPRERSRWNIATRGTNGSGAGTYLDEIGWKKNWYRARLNFMDTNLLDLPTIGSGGPVTPGTLVTIIPAAKAGTAIIYTLDGTDPRLPNGFVNPAALSNNGPTSATINSNARIFARSYNPLHRNQTGGNNPPISSPWSGPSEATYYTSVPPLRITEIMYHPADPPVGNTNDQDNFEYIEVRNTGATLLNVNRYRLRGGVDFDFPNTTLAAGEAAVIVRHAAAFTSRYGLGPRILGVYSNDNLGNDGDRLILQGSVREPILDFTYQDNWYPSTDGAGFSLVIRDDSLPPSTWGDKASWRASGSLNGTPGGTDPGSPVIASIVISEALTHTDPSPGDAVEVFNPTGAPVDIGNWYLTDDFGTPRKYRIPAGTMVPANGYLVFYQSNSFGLGTDGFALGAQGDEIYLYSADSEGVLSGYVHGFDFGAQANGSTFGRYITSTGDDHFVTQSAPSMGSANVGPKVGPVVITEINYHPTEILLGRGYVDNCLDEFIELHNNTGSPVSLFDPNATTNRWRLRDAVSYEFPAGATIPAQGYILVVAIDPSDPGQAAGFRARNSVPAGVPLYGPFSGQLDNSTDSVELTRPDNPDTNGVPYILVDKVRYFDTAPWPAAADGIGPSLQRRSDTTYGNDPANWVAAGRTGGSGYGGGTPPAISQQPANVTLLASLTASFTVAASGTGPFTYQWRYNGTPIQGAISSILLLPNVAVNQAGLYSVAVLNSSGAVVSDDARLTVLVPANIISNPQDISVRIKPDPTAAPTTNATFSIGVTTGNPPLSMQWRFNGQNIPGATGNSYTVVDVKTNNWGVYSVAVTDGTGTIFSQGATLYPLIGLSYLVQPITLSNVPAGSLASFSAQYTGFPPPFTNQWRLGSGVLTNYLNDSGVSTYTFRAPSTPDTINSRYNLVVQNRANSQPGLRTVEVNLITVADTDGDGISDAVEISLGLNPNSAADGNGDLDSDGMKNSAEVIAGTDPTNPNSYLNAEESTSPGVINIAFRAIAIRTYTIQYSDDLSSGVWRKLADVAAQTTDRDIIITDPISRPGRLYRISTPAQ